MNDQEKANVELVRRYYDGCNSGDLDSLMSVFTPDVVHYFLPSRFPAIRGAEHLARYWRKFKLLLDPNWTVDRAIAQGNEVVIEWSCVWTPKDTEKKLIMRGSEWYVMRDGRIAEVRAYFVYDGQDDTELTDFPYRERGYPIVTP